MEGLGDSVRSAAADTLSERGIDRTPTGKEWACIRLASDFAPRRQAICSCSNVDKAS
jgi:hypothetical protein